MIQIHWIEIPYSRPEDTGEDWIAPILLANHGVLLRRIMYLCRREVLRWGNIRVNEDAKSLEFCLPIRFMLEHCTRYGNDGRKSQHGVFQKTDSMAQVRRKSLTSRFTFFSWLKHRMRHGKRTTCIQIPFWSEDQEIREVSSLEHLHAWPCTKLEPWKSLWERGTMWTNLKAWSDNNLFQAKVLRARYHGRR